MKPYTLITTDIHLTEKPEDQYRFELFTWIKEKFGNGIEQVYILGDLTDRKNYHADWFLLKVHHYLTELACHYEVRMIKGNHDYDQSDQHPFFAFLNDIEGLDYLINPDVDKKGVLYLPHSRDPKRDWKILEPNRNRPGDLRAIMMHQTFDGAISESGYKMSGMDWRQFEKWKCPIYSGDIHKPQQLGPITYVGSPFHIRYGDKFKPRCILVDKNFEPIEDVQFPAPRKMVIEIEDTSDLRMLKMKRGDMAKVKLYLPRSSFGTWPNKRDRIRSIARKRGLKLHSITLKEKKHRERPRLQKNIEIPKTRDRKNIYKSFCNRYEVRKDLAKAGSEFME